jgi:hypothetical protein
MRINVRVISAFLTVNLRNRARSPNPPLVENLDALKGSHLTASRGASTQSRGLHRRASSFHPDWTYERASLQPIC